MEGFAVALLVFMVLTLVMGSVLVRGVHKDWSDWEEWKLIAVASVCCTVLLGTWVSGTALAVLVLTGGAK